KRVVFNEKWGGHFAPELGGHFELESGAHFKLELGGQYHWNLHFVSRISYFISIWSNSFYYSNIDCSATDLLHNGEKEMGKIKKWCKV
ncbi:MAG: hypothetical protein PHW29_01875, partial [Flavobacterium sp.]|nr:hypothetical protein [Flavobacterium sp.]